MSPAPPHLQKWDVVMVLRLGASLSPEDVGKGLAVRSYAIQVGKPMGAGMLVVF